MEPSAPDDPQRASEGATPGHMGPPTSSAGPDDPSGYVHQPPTSQSTAAQTTPHRHDGRSSKGSRAGRFLRTGSGGRWWLWTGRAVLWAFILVVVFNGVRAPFVRVLQPSHPASSASGAGSTGFPASSASAYAMQFAHVYLNYGNGQEQERARRLARYLPEGADPQLGWNGDGAMKLEEAEVAGVQARDATHGVVTLSVRVSERWMRLAVPVYADHGAMVISGQPALMPRPPEAQLPPPAEKSVDEEAANELRRQLPGFFQAYAGGDGESLARYLAPGVSLTGFSGAVRFHSLDDVVVPAAGGDTRRVTATVTWQLLAGGDDSAGQLQQTYQLTVTKQNGRWYVKDIHGASGTGFS